MANRPPEPQVQLTDYLEARDNLIRSEMKTVGDQVAHGLTDLRRDIKTLETDVLKRPETAAVGKSVRNNLIGFGVIVATLVAIIWAAFDTGASITGSFSDDVLGARQAHQVQAEQIQAMDAKYEQIDSKLDQLIAAQETVEPQEAMQRD